MTKATMAAIVLTGAMLSPAFAQMPAHGAPGVEPTPSSPPQLPPSLPDTNGSVAAPIPLPEPPEAAAPPEAASPAASPADMPRPTTADPAGHGPAGTDNPPVQ